jgi:hypothetical protein
MPWYEPLTLADRLLLRCCPILKRYAWLVVIELRRPKAP